MNQDLREVAHTCVKTAKAKGAQEASATARVSRQVTLEWRDGRIEKVNEATSRGATVQLYVDGRYSVVSSSDLRPAALDSLIADSITMTRALTVDPFRTLPDPALYGGRPTVDLQLEDPDYGSLTPEARRATAREMEEAARSVRGKEAILSVTTGIDDTRGEAYRVASNGFEGGRTDTFFSAYAEVSVLDPDGRRPEDWDFEGSRFLRDLGGAADIGRRAAERALSRLGAQKAPSARMTLVVDPRTAGRLVGALLGPLSGAALQQKRSFLEGSLGQEIGSPLLDIADEPLLPRGFGSRHFDGEGISARRMPVVEQGVLKNYYLDTYYAKKLQMPPTTAGASNLTWTLGRRSQGELLRHVSEAILVTGFLGGNSNGTTGDYSLGIQGFRVRGGAVAEPVAEMNISGNLVDLMKSLTAVGDDPYPFSSVRTPTLVFENVQFAGL